MDNEILIQNLITAIEALIQQQGSLSRMQETGIELSAQKSRQDEVQFEAMSKLLLDLKTAQTQGNEAMATALARIGDTSKIDELCQKILTLTDAIKSDKETGDAEDKLERQALLEGFGKMTELLTAIAEEVKKKEQYAYDIEITPELFEKLKGKDGKTPEKGKDYFTESDKKELVSRATDVALARLQKDLKDINIPTAEKIVQVLRELPQDKKFTPKELGIELPPDLTEAVSRLQSQLNAFKEGTMGTGPIESLSNVSIEGLQDGYALKYDLATKTWKPGPAGGGSATWGAIGGNILDQTDLQTALSGKSNVGHTHDDRYYTETEIDSQMAGKSNVGHGHVAADISDFDTEVNANIDAKVSELVKGGVQFALFRSSGLVVGDGFRTVVPFAGTITGWVIATKDGSSADITLNVKKANYASVPTFTAIDGTEPIKLTAQNKNTDTTLVDWTTAVAAGDHVEITVESVTGIIAGVYGIINITKTT